ncbi:hypothetical protein BKK52_07570 [Rodentibacter trehalosifermentans]|uniref:Terminase n=1 Tax=Rodentibacter trehalosifermentans TaxID=1908263 RepID=A0A1V3J038_9PAST|nr:hypothetical protein [Rodentibacter trehalosifermentans]OOF47916.1 hypothetical protein BKK52_07570 [Rodentibacter trehalosifermentans]
MQYESYRKEFLQEFIRNGGFATRAFRAVVDCADTLPANTLRARASDLLNNPITQKNLKAILKRRIESDKRVTMRLLASAGLVEFAVKAWGIADTFALYERKQRENWGEE